MVQVIHRLAPQAEFYFHDSVGTGAQALDALRTLVEDYHVNLVVHDLHTLPYAPPYFMPDSLSQYVDSTMAQRNVTYLVTAGPGGALPFTEYESDVVPLAQDTESFQCAF
jgi:hypothetical protein